MPGQAMSEAHRESGVLPGAMAPREEEAQRECVVLPGARAQRVTVVKNFAASPAHDVLRP